ncbi:hypothetical protein D3C75_839740 [compost metagenome]
MVVIPIIIMKKISSGMVTARISVEERSMRRVAHSTAMGISVDKATWGIYRARKVSNCSTPS